MDKSHCFCTLKRAGRWRNDFDLSVDLAAVTGTVAHFYTEQKEIVYEFCQFKTTHDRPTLPIEC